MGVALGVQPSPWFRYNLRVEHVVIRGESTSIMAKVPSLRARFSSTLFMELVVGLSGIALIIFIIGHLTGNLLLLGGPEVFNGYVQSLEAMGPALWLARIGLIIVFVAHIGTAIQLTKMNRRVRQTRYAEHRYISQRKLGTRTMAITGVLTLLFLLLHLYDFTFAQKTGDHTIIPGMYDGQPMGLYGLVWNTFANPIHASLYILAMLGVGLHLSHAGSSLLVTLGVLSDRMTPKAELGAKILGAVVGVGFAMIPVYVLVRTYLVGV